MSHQDHEYRTGLFRDVTRGLSGNYSTKVHRSLERNYSDTKNEMEYDELLDVVKEVMSDYPEWSWNGQRWIEDEEDEQEDEDE